MEIKQRQDPSIQQYDCCGVMDLPVQLEEFMDLDMFLKKGMSHQYRPSIPVPDLLVNDDITNNRPNALLSSEDIPEDVWALLNDVENSWESGMAKGNESQANFQAPLVSGCETSDKINSNAFSEVSPTIQGLPCLDDNELYGEMKMLFAPANAVIGDSVQDVAPSAIATDVCQKNVSTNDLPVSFSNFDFSMDVNTPDVDIAMLMTGALDLFQTPDVDASHLNSDCPKLPEPQLQSLRPEQKNDASEQADVLLPAPSNVLTLRIDNSNQISTGNGTKLQLKRKASNSDCIYQVHEAALTNDATNSVSTIIITVVEANVNNSNSSALTTERSTSCLDEESNPPNKKMHLIEDRAEQRRKNNEASRKSRLNRKLKEKEMTIQAENLERRNEELRKRVEHLTSLRDTIKEKLIAVLKKKN